MRDREEFPGPDAQTDEALHAYPRATVSTYYHPVGTAKIETYSMFGHRPAAHSERDREPEVADASVMPSIVSASTNATVLAIAERAASLITGEHDLNELILTTLPV